VKPLALIPCILGLLVMGCGSRPDARKLVAKQAEATKHVAAARGQFAAAKTKLRETAAVHKKTVEQYTTATKWVTLLVPAVDSLLFRVPDEYKPEVEAIKAQVEELRIAIDLATDPIAATTQGIADTDSKVVEGEESLKLAIAAQDEINNKLAPEYVQKVNDVIVRAEKAEKNAVIAYAVAAAALLACGVMGYLLLKP